MSFSVSNNLDFSSLRLLLQAAKRNPQRLHLVGLSPKGASIFPPLNTLNADKETPVTDQHPDFTLTFQATLSESADLALRITAFLRSQGVYPGERVAVWAPNSPWHLLIHTACAGLQAVCVPLDQHYSAEEFALICGDAGPRVVFAGPQQLARLSNFSFPEGATQPQFLDITSLPQLLRSVQAAEETDILPCDAECLGAILYTSGTSTHPKGVALTHANLWWGCRNFREVFEYSSDFVEAVVAPLSHIGGFNGTTLDLVYSGGTVIVIESFSPTAVLAALEFFKVQMMFGVPTIYRRLLADPAYKTRDLSAFIRPLIGGSLLPEDLATQMCAAGWIPYNVWGMTEQSASGTCLSPGMSSPAPNSVGTPFPYTKVRVVRYAEEKPVLDPNTQDLVDCPIGETGMLVCAGPSVTRGYWHDPVLNASCFMGEWLVTGDLGYAGADGSFHFVARATDTINTGGEKVLPEPVAEALRSLPQVRDAQVLGLSNQQWGQVVAAVIISEGAYLTSLTDAEVLEFIRSELSTVLARYKLPKAVRVVEAFPLSSNGKISKAGLQALFA